MPVFLPPISRRRFLKGSLAASAVVAAGGCATHKPASDGQSWALLSDIHIAADPNLVHSNVNMTRNLQTVAQEVFDVSGAGDTVIATFSLAIAGGASPIEAAILSNHAAGIVVGKVGTATTSPEELLKSFKHG